MFKKRGLGLECWLMNLLTCAWYVSGVLPGVLIDESPDVRLMCWLMNLLTCAWCVPVLLIDVCLTCWLMCVCFVCLECCLMNLLTCACFVDWWISWRAPDVCLFCWLMCAWRVDWCVSVLCAWSVAWWISWRAPDLAKYKNRLGVKTNTCYATAIAYVFVFPAVALLVTIKSFNSMCRAVKWKAGIASEGQVKGN